MAVFAFPPSTAGPVQCAARIRRTVSAATSDFSCALLLKHPSNRSAYQSYSNYLSFRPYGEGSIGSSWRLVVTMMGRHKFFGERDRAISDY